MEAEYEFIILKDLGREIIDSEGNSSLKIIKRNVRSRVVYRLSDIYTVKQLIGLTGKIKKNTCTIGHLTDGEVDIVGKYKVIKNIVFSKNSRTKNVMGFRYG